VFEDKHPYLNANLSNTIKVGTNQPKYVQDYVFKVP